MPFDAFRVSQAGETSKLETNTASFQGGAQELGASAADMLWHADNMLANMTKEMKGQLNAKELKIAHLAMERELEASIPDNFKRQYEDAKEFGGWKKAADLITANILSTVHNFVNDYYSSRGRAKTIVDTADNVSWSGYVSKSDVSSALSKLYPDITAGDIAVAQEKWANPGASDERLAEVRRVAEAEDAEVSQKAEEENYLARGVEALTGGRQRDIDEQTRDATR